MQHQTKLYYEAHITIEPVFEEHLEFLKNLSKSYKFRVAELLMKKRLEDTGERSKYDTFMTGHGTDYEDICRRTQSVIVYLKASGFKVWRYKIEDTLLDSRTEDVFNLL